MEGRVGLREPGLIAQALQPFEPYVLFFHVHGPGVKTGRHVIRVEHRTWLYSTAPPSGNRFG